MTTASRSTATIRPALPADADRLARLRYEFRAGLAQATEPELNFVSRCGPWMAERLANQSWQAWVAECDGAMVGHAWLYIIEKLPNPVAEPEWHGYITNCYVQEAHRGKGIGSRLLAAALAACDARRCDAVVLWPTPQSRSRYQRPRLAPHNHRKQRPRPSR
jgi:ribosomal protein S18 acetylase RimI-like enzyme